MCLYLTLSREPRPGLMLFSVSIHPANPWEEKEVLHQLMSQLFTKPTGELLVLL